MTTDAPRTATACVDLLMRDVSAELVPPGDDPFPDAQHDAFIDHLAAMCAATWGWHDDVGLLPYAWRWAFFGAAAVEGERRLGWREPVPAIVAEGWERFGDWKASNLATAADGRTVLVDWVHLGEGPARHELGWYLALNRAKLPRGRSKEDVIDEFRAALERHGVPTAGWWWPHLRLALLGTVVQFGWEKALGDADEPGWWCDRALDGLERL